MKFLTKQDVASSVENRVPFLDNEMVDFMFTIPENQLLHRQLFKMLKGKNANESKL